MRLFFTFNLLFFCLFSSIWAQDVLWQQEYQVEYNGEMTCAYSGGFSYAKPVLVDIDADGDLDLFVGNRRDNGIIFIRNDGTAANPAWVLVTRYLFDFLQPYTAPTFCDIDGDGDLDAFVGGWDGKIRFIRNTGTSSSPAWNLETEEFDSLDIGGHSTPTFCDIDNDGDFDLFIGANNSRVRFYRNTGSAGSYAFTLADTNFAQGQPSRYCVPVFFDIDNDADQDLFVGSSGRIYFYRNDGNANNGVWNLVTEEYGNILTQWLCAPAFGDIDNDSDADMIIGEDNIALSFYRNQGSQAIAEWKLVTKHFLTIDVNYPCYVDFADLDNDGDYDMFLGRYSFGIYKLTNSGTAQVPSWQFEDNYFIDDGYDLDFCDIDGDGDLDLFLGQRDGTINFWENQGTPGNTVWAEVVENYASINVANEICSPEFCDIDNDNDYDLFLGSDAGKLYYYQNTGNVNAPVWANPDSNLISISSTYQGKNKPALVDIDDDGDQDMFLGSTKGNVAFYRNEGTASAPSFSLVTSEYNFIVLGYQTCPEFVDIDGDGDQDMFVGSSSGGIYFWRNMGFTGLKEDTPVFSPEFFTLDQNYPNPFNPATTIKYQLARAAHVNISVYNSNGQLVEILIDRHQNQGSHIIEWKAGDLNSGLYFYRLKTDGYTYVRKALMLK